MNPSRHHFSLFASTSLCCLLLLTTSPVQAATVDDLLKQAADTPQSFNQQETLTVLFLAQEILHADVSLDGGTAAANSALVTTVAKVEQSKPRTDQQNGAPSTSEGSTTLTEKSGVAELLNLAIERGAITKTDSGTSYTLQTTPYLVYSKFGASDDNKETWAKTQQLRRIGISATFSQNGGDASQTGSDFESGEIKYSVLAKIGGLQIGSFNMRDPEVLDVIEADLKSVSPALNNLTQEIHDWENSHRAVDDAATLFLMKLRAHTGKMAVKDVENLLADSLKAARANLSVDDIESLRRLVAVIETEQTVRESTIQAAVAKAKSLIDTPHPQLSFSYGFQRDATSSDFSTFKVLFGYKNSPKLVYNLNGEWDINDKLKATDGTPLSRTRAYSFEADLTAGKFANDSCDFTAAAKWLRPMGVAHSMAFAQAKLNLYLTRGVTIPIALTYANRTEQSDHSSLRFNAGVAINADTFLGVARKGSS